MIVVVVIQSSLNPLLLITSLLVLVIFCVFLIPSSSDSDSSDSETTSDSDSDSDSGPVVYAGLYLDSSSGSDSDLDWVTDADFQSDDPFIKVTASSEADDNDFAIMGVTFVGKLVVYQGQRWKRIRYRVGGRYADRGDIVYHHKHKKFYFLSYQGVLLSVDAKTMEVTEVARLGNNFDDVDYANGVGRFKYLATSTSKEDDDLFLVYEYTNKTRDDDAFCYVYKFDHKTMMVNKLESLDGGVLFGSDLDLGSNSFFIRSAYEFAGGKKDCILHLFDQREEDLSNGCCSWLLLFNQCSSFLANTKLAMPQEKLEIEIILAFSKCLPSFLLFMSFFYIYSNVHKLNITRFSFLFT